MAGWSAARLASIYSGALLLACVLSTSELAASGTSATKEWWTPGCIAEPFPTTPSGPSVSMVASHPSPSGVDSVRVTAWRVPCGGQDYQLLLTYEPLSGSPYMATVQTHMLQGGHQHLGYFLLGAPPSFSGVLLAPVTVALLLVMSPEGAPEFDDDLAFELVFVHIGTGTTWRLQVPAAPSSGPPSAIAFRGALSGSWYDPQRPGQGLTLEFGRVGSRRIVFLAWYAQIAGQQAWIVGNDEYEQGDSSITLQLYRSSGGQFPNVPGSSAGTLVPWGSGTLQIRDCTTLDFSYQSSSQGNGTIRMNRGLSDGLDGHGCAN